MEREISVSRFKVEELCFDLRDEGKIAEFKVDPTAFAGRYELTDSEREAISNCDVGTLYEMGVLTHAISALSRAFGNDNATYVRKIRAAAALPENRDQLEVLQKRRR